MPKKSEISTVFIYAISVIIIIVVLYFGYRGVSGIQKANEDAKMEKMQLRLNADMRALSIRYGSVGRFSYDLNSDFRKLCFVDLNVAGVNATARNSYLANFLVINDSVASGKSENAFLVGKTTIALDVGKVRVSCNPFVFCINSSGGRISFFAEGGGDSVLINCS